MNSNPRRPAVAALLACSGALALVIVTPLSYVQKVQAASPGNASAEPLQLTPGQVQSLSVSQLTRVAIGDPEVADVTVVSQSEILIQAKRAGSTELIVWDAGGQRQTMINVVDPTPEIVRQRLTQLLRDLNLPSIRVTAEGGKVFLVGQVQTDEQLEVLEQVAVEYPEVVVNLVRVGEKAEVPAEELPPLVSLAVQIFELNRTDADKLGVKWSESASLTEPEATDRTVSDALFRWGTSLTRSSLQSTLNALIQQNKGRVLSEPKLVTASGKQASSFIGVEVPVIQATSFGTATTSVSASIEFRQTGVLLSMTPTVHVGDPQRRITTVLEAEVSDIDSSVGLQVPVGTQTILVPGFKVRRASTEVTTASGEPIIIAGLLELDDSEAVDQVPGFGRMPVLGRLFRSPILKSKRRELIITVTPELVLKEEVEVDRREVVERALAVAEVTASVDDPRLRYALQIQQRIANQIRYPEREKELGIGGAVKLRLHLFSDGTLERGMVAESSGVEALDLEAVKAAESLAPYPNFPEALTEEDLWLEIPVIFRP